MHDTDLKIFAHRERSKSIMTTSPFSTATSSNFSCFSACCYHYQLHQEAYHPRYQRSRPLYSLQALPQLLLLHPLYTCLGSFYLVEVEPCSPSQDVYL